MTNRQQRSEEVFARLFGPRDTTAHDADPEFGWILRKLVFGQVFDIGDLDDRTRELITVTVLASLQTLPQLRAHLGAALNVGVEPVALREAIYQLAPMMGFPRTLNALTVLNEVLAERGVPLPLPDQGTTTDDDRHERGSQIQQFLYGTEIRDALATLPHDFDEHAPDLLTDWLFGDFHTRTGLDLATRELLLLCALVALNLTGPIPAHVRGAMRAGNNAETILGALVQVAPYAGFPFALVGIRAVRDALDTPTAP